MEAIFDLLDSLRKPALPIGFRDLSAIVLPVSATLLGLVYTGLIYWFQGALERLTYTGDLLEDLIAAYGRILLDLLVGTGLVSLFGLIEVDTFASLSFWVFAILVTHDLLRATLEHGYIETISTKKIIPSNYGRVRTGLRKLWNAGFVNWMRALVVFVPAVIYPAWIGFAERITWRLNTSSLSVFLLAALALSLVRVRSLLLEALHARSILKSRLTSENQEHARELEEPEAEWDNQKKKIEQEIIRSELKGLGIYPEFEHPKLRERDKWSSRDLEGAPVLSGNPWVKDDGSCHLNLVAQDFDVADKLRQYTFHWARIILKCLANSKSGIHYYTISFFRNTDFNDKEHIGMFRSTKESILKSEEESESDREFVRNISGVFISDAIVP